MNSEYIARALCFHGQPMQKIWEDERGAGDLQKLGVPPQPNYSVYLERQKHFTFQDRAKRLKLHQFFSRKATDLYDAHLASDNTDDVSDEAERLANLQNAKPYIAELPPFEIFVNKNQEKFKRLRCLFEGIKPGDVIYGIVTKSHSPILQAPLIIKPLCTAEPIVRYLGDVTIKGLIQRPFIKSPLDKKGNPRSFAANDYVCCEVVDISIDADRLNLSMESSFNKNKNIKFGLVTIDDLPDYYRTITSVGTQKYHDCLINSKEFLNPNYEVLFELNGLDINDKFTFISALKKPIPLHSYAKQLRQAQASKWAFRSVAEGIEHFKIGRHTEAFQCLNKALSIDPNNVEGLVARGALFANKGSFLKAVEDFTNALELNSLHVNARKYICETLVALGRSYEEENRLDDAVRAYRNCLNIIPNHEQARLSMEMLYQRPGSQLLDNLLNIQGSSDVNNLVPPTIGAVKAIAKSEQSHNSPLSSSSSSSNNSNSNSSSTNNANSNNNKNNNNSSSSDSTDSGSATGSNSSERAKKCTKSKRHSSSISPLSRPTIQGAAGTIATAASSSTSLTNARNQYSQPFYMANQSNADANALRNPNDFRLDDDDTESRVRKLLQDASKYKKEKTKKSKKKKSKKAKKESRKEKTSQPLLGPLGSRINAKDDFHNIEDDHLQSECKYSDDLRQAEDDPTSSNRATNNSAGGRIATPPPQLPSTCADEHEQEVSYEQGAPPSPPSMRPTGTSSDAYQSALVYAAEEQPAPRFSFTIKRPVKVDKFGLVRIATPLTVTRSHTRSRSRSRSRSTSEHRQRHVRRSRSHSVHSKSRESNRCRRRSRSRSSSFDRRHRRRSRSRSRSRYRYNRGRLSRSRSSSLRRRYRKRRSPSPFRRRASPSSRRRSRSRTRFRGRNSRRFSPRPNFGNRVWQRPGYAPGDINSDTDNCDNKNDEGESIEEIDRIITKAQKERKEEIIKRDKNILKKPA